MKNSSVKRSFHRFSSLNASGEANENINNSSKQGNSIMTEQLTIPPAHVWDKIEQILDEQDNRRKEASKIIASSFKMNRRRLYATVAGLSIIVGIIWIIL